MRFGPRSSFAIIAIAGTLLGAAFWLVPGLSPEVWSAILPEWALSSEVSHTISSMRIPSSAIDQARLRDTVQDFVASHGMTYIDYAGNTPYPTSDIMRSRLSFESNKYAFDYIGGEDLEISLESQPGKNGNHDAMKREFLAAFGPLGFVEQPASPD